MKKLVILAALLAFGATMVGCHADAGGDTHVPQLMCTNATHFGFWIWLR